MSDGILPVCQTHRTSSNNRNIHSNAAQQPAPTFSLMPPVRRGHHPDHRLRDTAAQTQRRCRGKRSAGHCRHGRKPADARPNRRGPRQPGGRGPALPGTGANQRLPVARGLSTARRRRIDPWRLSGHRRTAAPAAGPTSAHTATTPATAHHRRAHRAAPPRPGPGAGPAAPAGDTFPGARTNHRPHPATGRSLCPTGQLP